MRELSYSAYVVLGLIARYGPMTPYDLKARLEESVGVYWPIPHAQLYRDPERLADLGLLTEHAESGGRRRRTFDLTAEGRATLDRWLTDPNTEPPENRDPALLKLTFIDLVDPSELRALAAGRAAQHRAWLQDYRDRRAGIDPDDPAAVTRGRLLDLGLRYEQAYTDFWESVMSE